MADEQVGATGGANAEEENKKKEAELKIKEKEIRSAECQLKIKEILRQYNCDTEVDMTIGTNGHIKANINIIAK